MSNLNFRTFYFDLRGSQSGREKRRGENKESLLLELENLSGIVFLDPTGMRQG